MWLPGDVLERVEDLVGAVAILNAELATLRRQHAACEFLLSAAEERIQGNFATDEEHAKLYTQLLQLATTVETETKKVWEACNSTQHTPSERSGSGTAADGSSIEAFLSDQAKSPSFPPSGSAAVNFARAEHCRATILQGQVARLLAEQQRLQSELKRARCGELSLTTASKHATLKTC